MSSRVRHWVSDVDGATTRFDIPVTHLVSSNGPVQEGVPS
jgi:hypothetical protein